MRYRVREGMAAWMLHRITGLGIVLFLLVHIADITLVGWGPNLFNKLLFLYRAAPFRLGEIILLAAVVFHALNGIRIILVDFTAAGVRAQRGLFYGELSLCVILFVPSAWWMIVH